MDFYRRSCAEMQPKIEAALDGRDQWLLASDATPTDREHACAVGELRLDPADGLVERRRRQVVEDL